MKRRICISWVSRVILVILVAIKLALGATLLNRVLSSPLPIENEAIASEPQIPSNKQTGKPAGKPTEKPIEKPAGKPAGQPEQGKAPTELDLAVLLRKQAELEEKERELAAQKAELVEIQASLKEKIESLSKLRSTIQSETDRKNLADEQKLKHLIKVYSAMKPQNAAGLIEKMETRFAVQLFLRMNGEAVGNILSYVKIEKAAEISEGLLKRQ